MKDKVAALLDICTKLVEPAAVLEIVELELDTNHSSERVGHWREGYQFTGYGELTLKVKFAPPNPPPIPSISSVLNEANPFKGGNIDVVGRIEAANLIEDAKGGDQ